MTAHIAPPAALTPGSVVWAYLRDSGGEGQEQSVMQQRQEVEAYAERYGLVLATVFADVARSGGSVVGRDDFQEMMDASTDDKQRPAGVLLWNFARFSRDLDDASYYKATLRKRGMVVHSLTDPIPDGAWGRVAETILDISNEEKRRQTSRDVKRSKVAMVKAGYSSGGLPPRGYLAAKTTNGYKRDGTPRVVSRWVEDPELWPLVQLAWKLRAEGKTFHEIGRATGGRLYKARNCFASMFRNRTYLGIGKAGELEIPNHHPAAIDQATWDAVKALREAYPAYGQAGHPHHPRRVGAPSLLSGLATCQHCGSAMVYGVANSGRDKTYLWPFYMCSKKNRMGAASCESRRINARRAEAAILKAVTDQVLTADYAAELLADVKALLSDTSALDREIESLDRQARDCARAIANLVELAESFGARAAGAKLVEREGEQLELAARLRQANARRAAAQLDVTPAALAMALNVWRTQLAGDTGSEAEQVRARRATLSRFVSKLEMGYKQAHVWYTYPLGDFTQIQAWPLRGHLAILSKDILLTWE